MNKKIAHLPHVKRHLELLARKIEKDIQARAYDRALKNIKFLEKQQFYYPAIYKNKLFCLTKLERWAEAEALSETLLKRQNDRDYVEYFLYYLTSLYHQGQYSFVQQLIEDHLGDVRITNEHREYLCHLQNESLKKLKEKSNELLKKLELAILTKNEIEQWLLINRWKALNAPPAKLILEMLSMAEVNPFVKTAILFELHERNIEDVVYIEKNGRKLKIKAAELPYLTEHPLYVDALKHLEAVEQKDPTLYSFSVELLERSLEYDYPFMEDAKNVDLIAEAATLAAKEHLFGKVGSEMEENEELLANKQQIEAKYEAFLRLTIA